MSHGAYDAFEESGQRSPAVRAGEGASGMATGAVNPQPSPGSSDASCEHQVSLVSGKCVKCGWHHPILGPVKPDHWLVMSA